MEKGKKEKHVIGPFTGGLIGAALGVAAGMFLASESGKKFRAGAKDQAGEFYRYLAPKMKKLGKMGEGEYQAFVSQAVKKYAVLKKLSEAETKSLAAEAKKAWKYLKKHLSGEA